MPTFREPYRQGVGSLGCHRCPDSGGENLKIISLQPVSVTFSFSGYFYASRCHRFHAGTTLSILWDFHYRQRCGFAQDKEDFYQSGVFSLQLIYYHYSLILSKQGLI